MQSRKVKNCSNIIVEGMGFSYFLSLRQFLTIHDRTVLNPILPSIITHLYITLRCSALFYSAQLAKTIKVTRFRKISSSIDRNDERSL